MKTTCSVLLVLFLAGCGGAPDGEPSSEADTPTSASSPAEPAAVPPSASKADTASLTAELKRAVAFGQSEQAVSLIKQGADVLSTDRYGHPMLFLAARKGDPELIRALVDGGAGVNQTLATSYNDDGVGYAGTTDGTPLTYACGAGQLEAARVLVELGAEVNGAGPGGTTALMAAAESGKADVVAWLLEQGATAGKDKARGLAQRMINPSPEYQRVIELLAP